MPENYQEIIGDGPILRMLERIREHHGLIHVRIKNKGSPSSSAIISTNAANRTWQFDELPSEEHNRLLLKERICGIEAKLDGVTVKFQAEVNESGSDEKGLIYYQSALPRTIQVYQRRGSFRAALPAAQRATISFVIPEVPMIRGRVYNISSGGIGINLSQSLQGIGRGLDLSHATLTLPNGKLVSCDLKICFVSRGNLGGMSVGARFTSISRVDQKTVSRFVAMLDREHAKRNHATGKYDAPKQKAQPTETTPETKKTSYRGKLFSFLLGIKRKILSRA